MLGFATGDRVPRLSDLTDWYVIGSGTPLNGIVSPSSVVSSATTSVTCSAFHRLHGVTNYIRLAYGLYCKDTGTSVGEIALPNAVTIHAAWQGSDGVVREATFSGATTVSDTHALFVSDPIPYSTHWGNHGWALTAFSVASSELLIPGAWTGMSDTGRENRPLGEGVCAGDVVLSGRDAVGTNSANGKMFGPAAILGYFPGGVGAPQSFYGLGDSHWAGSNDSSAAGRGIGGPIVRLCLGQFNGAVDLTIGSRAPYLCVWTGGESTRQHLDNNSPVRRGLLDFCTEAFLECSNHDAENGADATTWKAVMQEAARWLSQGRHIRRIHVCTPYPKANSTDHFITAGNQTGTSPSSRPAMMSYLLDTGPTGYVEQTKPTLRGGQELIVHDVASAIEVDSTNTPTQNGSRFIVGDLSADYTATVANTNNLGSSSARFTFSGSAPAVGVLQGAVCRYTTGAQADKFCNVEYDTTISDGTRRVVFSPPIGAAAVGDMMEFYLVTSANAKGASTDGASGGVHLLKNGVVRVAKYLDGRGIILNTTVTPDSSAPAVASPFDPYAIDSVYLFDPGDISKMFKDTGGTTAVTADNDVLKLFKGGNVNTTQHNVSDSVGATYKSTGGSISQPYVLFNGTTQKLRLASGTSMSGPCFFIVVYRQVSVLPSGRIFSSNDTSNRMELNNASGGTAMFFNGGTNQSIGAAGDTTLRTMLISVNGASGYIYVNGVKTTKNFGTGTMNGLTLGASFNSSTTNPSNIELYWFSAHTGTPTGGQEASINQWLASVRFQ